MDTGKWFNQLKPNSQWSLLNYQLESVLKWQDVRSQLLGLAENPINDVLKVHSNSIKMLDIAYKRQMGLSFSKTRLAFVKVSWKGARNSHASFILVQLHN